MFTLTKTLPNITLSVQRLGLTSVSQHCLSTNSQPKWDLFASICVERNPLVVPKMNVLEQNVQKALEQYELARSLKSDHEIQNINDEKRQQQIESGAKVEEELPESFQTAQDFEEKSKKELLSFEQFESQHPVVEITDKKSLKRCQDRNLILVCKQKFGDNFDWVLPEQKLQEKENLRQAADRCLSLFDKSSLDVKIVGNCPFAMLKYKYPKKLAAKLQSDGKKVYFFKAFLLEGNLEDAHLDKQLFEDFGWLTRQECQQLFDRPYWSSFKNGLLIEGPHPNTLQMVLERVGDKVKRPDQNKQQQVAQN